MAWCCEAISHYLIHCWLRSISPNGITKQQWVHKSHFPLIYTCVTPQWNDNLLQNSVIVSISVTYWTSSELFKRFPSMLNNHVVFTVQYDTINVAPQWRQRKLNGWCPLGDILQQHAIPVKVQMHSHDSSRVATLFDTLLKVASQVSFDIGFLWWETDRVKLAGRVDGIVKLAIFLLQIISEYWIYNV